MYEARKTFLSLSHPQNLCYYAGAVGIAIALEQSQSLHPCMAWGANMPCKAFLFCWMFSNLSTRMDHIIQMGGMFPSSQPHVYCMSHSVPSCFSFPHVLWAFSFLTKHPRESHRDEERCAVQQRMSIFLSAQFLFSHLRAQQQQRYVFQCCSEQSWLFDNRPLMGNCDRMGIQRRQDLE